MWPVGLLALALALVVAACARSSDAEGASGDGRERICVLSPALAATLVELGLGDRIVGRHGYDLVLGEGVPAVGDESGIDAEALLRIRPTHVLVESTSEQTLSALRALGGDAGFVVEVFPLRTLADIEASAGRCVALFAGDDGRARARLARFREAMRPRPAGFGGRVLMLADETPPLAIGGDSFHGQMLERMGCANALGAGTAWANLDAEDLVRLDPDGLILLHPRTGGGVSAVDHLASLRGLGLRAIERERVLVVDDPLCLLPSLALDRVGDQIREALGAWGDGG